VTKASIATPFLKQHERGRNRRSETTKDATRRTKHSRSNKAEGTGRIIPALHNVEERLNRNKKHFNTNPKMAVEEHR
jgi:hypothetical protein